jgi:hypothetical protein
LSDSAEGEAIRRMSERPASRMGIEALAREAGGPRSAGPGRKVCSGCTVQWSMPPWCALPTGLYSRVTPSGHSTATGTPHLVGVADDVGGPAHATGGACRPSPPSEAQDLGAFLAQFAARYRWRMSSLVQWASSYAEGLLGPLGDRWAHVEAVAEQARPDRSRHPPRPKGGRFSSLRRGSTTSGYPALETTGVSSPGRRAPLGDPGCRPATLLPGRPPLRRHLRGRGARLNAMPLG